MYHLEIKESKAFINGVEIDQEIEDIIGWSIRDISDYIYQLEKVWIPETEQQNPDNPMLDEMISDLQLLTEYLETDSVCLSSLETNRYLFESDNTQEFQDICKRMLEEQKNKA